MFDLAHSPATTLVSLLLAATVTTAVLGGLDLIASRRVAGLLEAKATVDPRGAPVTQATGPVVTCARNG